MFSRNILNGEFVVAAGNGDEIVKIAGALELMFDFDLKVQEYGKEKFILLAEVKDSKNIDKRRDSVLKATDELISRYNLSCEIGDYHGFVMPEKAELDIKGYSFEQAITDFNVDRLFSNKQTDEFESLMKNLDKNNFKRQFKFIYEKEPTEKQLEIFIKFMCGLERDIDKVTKICSGDGSANESQPAAY